MMHLKFPQRCEQRNRLHEIQIMLGETPLEMGTDSHPVKDHIGEVNARINAQPSTRRKYMRR